MLSKRLLGAFIFGFYGYGNYDAKYWFVGMEEGIKKSKDSDKLDKITRKLKLWNKRGHKELEDLRDFHLALGPNKHFDDRAVLQATWKKIIRILLVIEGKKPTIPHIRDYQRCSLARKSGDSCLVELLPLPSPNRIGFLFDKYSKTIPFLESPDVYKKYVRTKRIARLKKRIEKHHPKAVVFYGKGNWKHYQKIAGEGVEFQSMKIDGVKVKVSRNKDTLFVLTEHLVAHGVTNEHVDRIGRMISEHGKQN